MRKMTIIGIAALSLLISCRGEDSFKRRVESLLNDFGVSSKEYNYVAVINLDACSNCHGIVDDFLFRNQDSEELVVVLTSHSKKKIDQRYPDFDKLKVIKDVEGLSIYQYDILGLKPVIIHLSDDFRYEEYKLFEFSQKVFP